MTTTTTRGHVLLEAAARATGLTPAALRGPSRAQALTRSRQVVAAALIMRGLTLKEAGRALHRDHSTILHARDRVARDPALLRTARALAVTLARPRAVPRLAREARAAAIILEAEGYPATAQSLRLAAEGVGCGA